MSLLTPPEVHLPALSSSPDPEVTGLMRFLVLWLWGSHSGRGRCSVVA